MQNISDAAALLTALRTSRAAVIWSNGFVPCSCCVVQPWAGHDTSGHFALVRSYLVRLRSFLIVTCWARSARSVPVFTGGV